MATKIKIKGLKEEMSRKLEESLEEKDKYIRSIVQDSKQIKMRYEDMHREMDKIKNENKMLEKSNANLSLNLNQM